ncbi:MAG: M48 family metalloprotease [Acidobacteriota bacterium]|nr:M48 family metalloprotease [Acidobacteriota bacterium]
MNGSVHRRRPLRLRSASALGLCGLLLPWLAARPLAAQRISDERLFAQSFEAAHQALRFFGPYEDDVELRRVTDIGFQLAQASGFTDYPFTFHLVDMPVPNAFALPGGQIFITRGMLKMGLTDDELAGLLGHEIGHVVENHGIRTQKRARLLNVLGQALVIGVLVNEVNRDEGRRNDPYIDPYAGRDSASRVQGAAAASLVTSELLMRSYSREFEDEADATGQRLAAQAGYDPAGTGSLMNKMSVHIPQTKEYGYWQTHPFFDQRVQHADVRGGLLKVAGARPDAALFRAATQRVLLDWAAKQGLEEDAFDYARTVALHTWPRGAAADEIRLAKLHELRDAESAQAPLAQDFGTLIASYEREVEDLEELSPESPLIPALGREIAEFEERRQARYEDALAVFEGGIYETHFLETFLSNYPRSSATAAVELELGEAYSRLGRHGEAVARFLGASSAAPESDAGQRARRGLTVLATRLRDLAALERLAAGADQEIAAPAAKRLADLAPRFDRVEDGAAYLDAFPEGQHAAEVTSRLNNLADDLYGEVVLYQTVGDAAQAVTGIQRILTYAPFSPAAERLRQRMILEG